MVEDKQLLLIAFLLIILCHLSQSSDKDPKDGECQLFPIMLPTGSNNHVDSFIVVHQCRGRKPGPVSNSNLQCVNMTVEFVRNIRDEEGEEVPIYNHTSCGMACVCGHNSNKNERACISPKIRQGVCYHHQQWNAGTCKCECKKRKGEDEPGTNKVVNRKQFGSSLIPSGVLIASLVGEFIVIVSITYCIYHKRVTRKKPNSNPTVVASENGEVRRTISQQNSPTCEDDVFRHGNSLSDNGSVSLMPRQGESDAD